MVKNWDSNNYTNKISKLLIEVNQIMLMNILNELNNISIQNKLQDFSPIIQKNNNKQVLSYLTLEQLKDIRKELDNIISKKENNIQKLFEDFNQDWTIVT